VAGDDARTAGVVVTRDEGPDGPLTRLLRERGFRVHSWPAIRIAPPADPGPLDEALASLESFGWIVFTSRRAVAAVVDRVSRPPASLRVAAVGSGTAGALADAGWTADLVPGTQTGESLLESLVDAGVGAGTRVLFPASAIARDTVPDGLIEAGAVVVQVEAYRTEPGELDREECAAALENGVVDVVTYTSPSTVENLERALGPELFDRVRRETRAVAIGPTTGEAARVAGLDVVVAEPHSLEGLADRVAAVAVRNRIEEV
jgi:uroporphyrinogen-III synthase